MSNQAGAPMSNQARMEQAELRKEITNRMLDKATAAAAFMPEALPLTQEEVEAAEQEAKDVLMLGRDVHPTTRGIAILTLRWVATLRAIADREPKP